MSNPTHARWALLPAVLAVSSSAIFVRFASAPPIGAAFWRGAIAGMALLPFFAYPPFFRQLLAMGRREVALIALATTVIAVHQICFISSLSYTTVAASTFLTSTQPIFTALLGGILIREHVSARSWLAIIGAILGMALITFSHPASGAASGSALKGNLLALLAALLASLYTLAARRLRQKTPLVPYMFVVHLSGTVFLAIIVALTGTPLTGYSTHTWTGLMLLGLIPTFIGHTLLTYSVGHLPAFVVNASILGEPVGATLMAAMFFGEHPPLQTVAGAAVVLACILVIVLERDKRKIDGVS